MIAQSRISPTVCIIILSMVGFGSSVHADTYSGIILNDDPVLYWRLGETSGTTAENLGSLGSAGDGTYGSLVTYGETGLAPGSTDGGGIGLVENTQSRVLLDPFDMPANDVSVSFWMNSSSSGLTHFFGYAVSGSTNEFTFGGNGSGFRAIVNGDLRDFATNGLIDQTDRHIGISWTDSTGLLSVYINGSLEISHNFAAGQALGANGALAIGQDFDSRSGPGYGFSSGQAFRGTIDEFAIFDRVLTAAEFSRHASAVPEPGCGLLASLLLGSVVLVRRQPKTGRLSERESTCRS